MDLTRNFLVPAPRFRIDSDAILVKAIEARKTRFSMPSLAYYRSIKLSTSPLMIRLTEALKANPPFVSTKINGGAMESGADFVAIFSSEYANSVISAIACEPSIHQITYPISIKIRLKLSTFRF